MSENYNPMSYAYLESGVTYRRPPQRLPDRVKLTSPATDVMTDLTKVAGMTMGPCAGLDAAHQRMVASGVRLLMVADQQNNILGIITSTDLSGDRPLKYLQEVGGKREDIFIRDIMTPQEKLEVLSIADVERAHVGDVVATMKTVGRQHALVVDTDADGNQVIRGIFSAKQIGMQLGESIDTIEIAKTFAEVVGR
ncbi:hypothetical protein BOW53_03470 [Solemya pervernicosa gill symbiont]|uniref:CBS domain-containing protein n=2 Tax=Gammaproteobacteria incertae sedis TaxID=118884 RepID=A0A1T2L920_9GAMM|nr:CBS domain-containing protein [Candidatus Reidiella endopervernicosa]OOZ41581.1 hypothetical protein BOW53_03470 [Solemya pervernicosa gill symbiont]QKQ27986.1 CBS domain-containing protein [Candidatus Reidiella endopervernicosa]